MTDDTARKREYFLYAFALHGMVTWAVTTWKIYGHTEDDYIETLCERLQKEGAFKEEMIRSMAECHDRYGQAIFFAFIIVSVLMALLFWHLIRVAYTHW